MSSGPGPPTLTPTNSALRHTGATGSITNEPNGTATGFVWAGPGINATNINVEDPTGLTPGTYTVTVTYSGGSTATATATVTAPPAVSMTQTTVGVTCFGDLRWLYRHHPCWRHRALHLFMGWPNGLYRDHTRHYRCKNGQLRGHHHRCQQVHLYFSSGECIIAHCHQRTEQQHRHHHGHLLRRRQWRYYHCTTRRHSALYLRLEQRRR